MSRPINEHPNTINMIYKHNYVTQPGILNNFPLYLCMQILLPSILAILMAACITKMNAVAH